MLKVENNYNNMPLTGNGPAYSSAYKSLLTLVQRVLKAQKLFSPLHSGPKQKGINRSLFEENMKMCKCITVVTNFVICLTIPNISNDVLGG